MAKLLIILFILLSELLVINAWAQQAPTGSNVSLARRTYPGGRDDTDLSVQSLKQVVRAKSGEDEIREGYDYGGGSEFDSMSTEGFGE